MLRRLFLFMAGLALIAGCGGGGGGTSGYSGATTQAVVNSSNAKQLSVDAYNGGQLSAAASGVAKDAGGGGADSALLQQAAVTLKNGVAAVFNPNNTTAKAAALTAQNTIYGYSGYLTYSISYDQLSGAFSGSITFSQYQDSSSAPTLNGAITFSGSYNQATGMFNSLSISISGLSGTSDGRSFRLSGTLTYGASGSTETVSMSVVLTDSLIGRTYWVRDYVMTLIGGTSLTLSGTYYDPFYGYVVISTVTPLTVSSFDAIPTAGQLLFSGSNGTKARLTFNSGGYVVEVDANGGGTFVPVSSGSGAII